jgi:two-component system nitrogen regulation response regulator GlnG
MLVNHFRRIANGELNKNVREISAEAMTCLRQYSWPGNIRELQNVVKQAILKSTGPMLLPDFLPTLEESELLSVADRLEETRRPQLETTGQSHPLANTASEPYVGQAKLDGGFDTFIQERLKTDSGNLYAKVIGHVESRLVKLALDRSAGNKAAAVQMLGVNPSSLQSQTALKQLGMESLQSDIKEPVIFRPGMTMVEIEREAIRGALVKSDGCRKAAAKLLGMSTRTMQRRVKEYKLE